MFKQQINLIVAAISDLGVFIFTFWSFFQKCREIESSLFSQNDPEMLLNNNELQNGSCSQKHKTISLKSLFFWVNISQIDLLQSNSKVFVFWKKFVKSQIHVWKIRIFQSHRFYVYCVWSDKITKKLWQKKFCDFTHITRKILVTEKFLFSTRKICDFTKFSEQSGKKTSFNAAISP